MSISILKGKIIILHREGEEEIIDALKRLGLDVEVEAKSLCG